MEASRISKGFHLLFRVKVWHARCVTASVIALSGLLSLQPALATSNTWNGGNATSGNWTTATNWVGGTNVPGVGDTATFNTAIINTWGASGSPIVIDSTSQNIKSITFDTSAGNFTLGTTGGNSLFLGSGGTLQIAGTTTNNSTTQTINAPMVIVGANGTYSFANNKNNIASSLVLGGAISGGTAGNTVITFDSVQSAAPNQANGIISNGSATSMALVHSTGTWTYSGNNTYTGSTTVKAGAANFSGNYTGGGTLVLQSADGSTGTPTVTITGSSNFSGDIALNGLGNTAFLNLGSAISAGGAVTNATSITLNGLATSNARLSINNTAGNLDRISDNATINIGYGSITLTGNTATNTTETVGTLALTTGQSSINLVSAAGRVTAFSASSLTRSNNGTLQVTGTNLGANGTNTSRVFLTTAPLGGNFVGTGGAPTSPSSGVKNLGITPWMVAGTASATDFATYDTTNGIRALSSNEVQTSLAAAVAPTGGQTGDNVKISVASESGITTKTANSLFFAAGANQTVTGGGAGNTLTLSSGGMAQSGAFTSTISGFDSITFGNGEAVISTVTTTGTLAVNSGIGVTSSGGLTKSGTGTLILGAANTYSGPTIIQAGVLQIGNGGTAGDLGSSSRVSVLGGGTLNYSRTDALTINSVGGGGRLNVNAAGTLTLNQVGSGLSLKAVGGVSGATIVFGGDGTGVTSLGNSLNSALSYMAVAGQNYKFTGGTVNLLDGARGFTSNIEVAGGTLNLVNNNLSMAGISGGIQTLTLSSGQINALSSFGVSGLNGNGGPTIAGANNSTFTGTQTGGTLTISAASGRFDLGSTSSNNVSTYTLSGGTINHAVGTGGFRLGADTAGTSNTTFNFSGGKILENISIIGTQGAGAKQSFVWTGGTLATLLFDATNLTPTSGTAVVLNSTNTLINGGGILAPGDIGTVGRTQVTGNYNGTSSNASLAIDIGGTGTTSVFQEAPGSGKFDRFNISGTGALGGKLNVALVDSFTPTNGNSFLILTTAAAGLSGNFTNGATANGGGIRVALADGLSSFKVNYNTANVTLGSYQATNTYSGAGTAWDTASAAAWTNLDAGATATPGTQASNAIAQFADGTASTGNISVSLNSTRNIQGMQFSSNATGGSTRNYTIAQGGSGGIVLDNTGNGGSATIADSSTSGNANAINVPISLSSNLSVSVTNATNRLTIGGAISGANKSLIKSGAGTLTLSGNNSYTGTTTISAGTLLVNGNSTAATGALSVSSGGALGGSGTVGGATTISGDLKPGNSPGLLTFASSLGLTGNATTTMEINGDAVRGTDFDGVNVGTSLLYGGNLTLAFGTTFGVGTYTFNLFDFASQSGDFAAVTLSGNYTGSFSGPSGGDWTFTQANGLGGNNTWTFAQSTGDLGLNVVPEPATWGLLAFSLTTVIVLRRRRSYR